jgi:hypothetical protein
MHYPVMTERQVAFRWKISLKTLRRCSAVQRNGCECECVCVGQSSHPTVCVRWWKAGLQMTFLSRSCASCFESSRNSYHSPDEYGSVKNRP